MQMQKHKMLKTLHPRLDLQECKCAIFYADPSGPSGKLLRFATCKKAPFSKQTMTHHPVLDALRASGKVSDEDLAYLIDHGRPYFGIRLPTGIKRRPPGSCFATADDLEDLGEGRRVRGFALRPGSSKALAHAWISPNGRDAIDAVWTRTPHCEFWGIPGHGHEARLKRMSRPFVNSSTFNPLAGLIW